MKEKKEKTIFNYGVVVTEEGKIKIRDIETLNLAYKLLDNLKEKLKE